MVRNMTQLGCGAAVIAAHFHSRDPAKIVRGIKRDCPFVNLANLAKKLIRLGSCRRPEPLRIRGSSLLKGMGPVLFYATAEQIVNQDLESAILARCN